MFTRAKFHQYSPSGPWVIKKVLCKGLITLLSKFNKCVFMLQRTRYLKDRKIIINIRDGVRQLLKLKRLPVNCQLWECLNTLRHWYAKQISTYFIDLSAVFVHIPSTFCSKCIYFKRKLHVNWKDMGSSGNYF